MDKTLRTILTILGGISVIVVIAGGVLAIWYTYLPEMVWLSQVSSSGQNSCNLQVYANACPASLKNGNASYIYLKNIGDVPAVFIVNYSSSNSVNVKYYDNVWKTSGNQTADFGFIPSFSSNSNSMSIQFNASCSAETLFCRNSKLSINCLYNVSGNVAVLVPSGHTN